MTDVPILRVLPDKLIIAFCCDQLFLFSDGDRFWLCGHTTEDDVLHKKDLRSLNSRLNDSGRQFPSRGHRDDSQFDKALAVLALTAVSPLANGQHCDPTCAAPCDPTCAVPSECSTCGNGNSCNTCYQPQQINCEPQGLFRARPMFNLTRIHIENREKCCQPQAQCCPPAQPAAMAMPMMAMQPVQLQMTAYQPMMMQSMPVQQMSFQSVPMQQMAIQSAPVQQFVQSVPVQQVVQQVQSVPVQQVQMIQSQPRTVSIQSTGGDCNLEQVCQDLKALKTRVEELKEKVDNQVNGEGSLKDLERRVAQNEAAIKSQTEILTEIKTYFQRSTPQPQQVQPVPQVPVNPAQVAP